MLCVDEKSGMQALDRSQPVLPMIPGMPERRSHDYARHGVTTLLAAFDTTDGTMISALHRQHRAVEFKKFLIAIDKARTGRARRAPGVWQPGHPQALRHPGLAGQTPTFTFDFTPTGRSWINQVERGSACSPSNY